MIKNLVKRLIGRGQFLYMEYPVRFKPRWGEKGNTTVYSIVSHKNYVYANYLKYFLELKQEFLEIKKKDEDPAVQEPFWNNGFLPGLDIVALYSMLVKNNPERYIEVGSGNSTLVSRLAIKNHNLRTKIVSIDPLPRADIDAISDVVIRKPFEDVTDFLNELKITRNDVVFIDNSHRVLPNSDATVFFMEWMPILPEGTLVHIHDIYLPYDYPQFMCDRGYSEQYVLAAFLMANPQKYSVEFPCYFVSQDPELSKILAPLWTEPKLQNVETHGGSFWLRIGKS
ncbi:MAG: class I SAM-dependent methyltransferase [Flavobacteriales bacterium]